MQRCLEVVSGKELIQSIGDGEHTDCGKKNASPFASEKKGSSQANNGISSSPNNPIRESNNDG